MSRDKEKKGGGNDDEAKEGVPSGSHDDDKERSFLSQCVVSDGTKWVWIE